MADFDRKFFFVTGKGGVGKTTVSVALARALSQRGKRVLLALTEPGSAAAMLGVEAVGERIEALDAHLSVVVLNPEAALVEYAEMTLHNRALAQASVGNRFSRAFLRAVPGLYPWAVLGSAWYRSVEVVAGQPRFDGVVFDAPATGHGLEMLRVPLVIREIAGPSVLARDAERAWSMFTDPTQTGVIVVSLAEELAMRETLELTSGLAELGIRPERVVVNACLPPLFASGELDRLERAARREQDPALLLLLRVAHRRAETEDAQAKIAASLGETVTCPVTALPWLESAGTPHGVSELANALWTGAGYG